jgi:hypothetical protein
MTHREREDASQGERPRLGLVDVTDDPGAADLRTVVVAFRCTACQQMLHIEYLVGPLPGGEAPAEGVACPQCARRHRLRLPGVVRDVRRAD